MYFGTTTVFINSTFHLEISVFHKSAQCRRKAVNWKMLSNANSFETETKNDQTSVDCLRLFTAPETTDICEAI